MPYRVYYRIKGHFYLHGNNDVLVITFISLTFCWPYQVFTIEIFHISYLWSWFQIVYHLIRLFHFFLHKKLFLKNHNVYKKEAYYHSLIKKQTLLYFYLGKSHMEISKDRHYLARFVLCGADAGHNNKEKSLSLLQPRCYEAVELGFNWPRRITWLLEKPCFWLCGDQGKPFQHVWEPDPGCLRQAREHFGKNLLNCAISDSVFFQLFPVKITCLNWAMQLCVGGVLIFRALRFGGVPSMVHYFFPRPHPEKPQK